MRRSRLQMMIDGLWTPAIILLASFYLAEMILQGLRMKYKESKRTPWSLD